jgi:5'-3' exoribonuclease 2
MSKTGMLELCKRGLHDGQRIDKLEFCEHCVYGKQMRVKFGTATHNTKDILEYIHSDLWGESRVPSLGGARYMLTIIEDYSRRVWSFYIKHKSDVFNTFKEWKIMIENQSGKRIKKLHTDNGLEFDSGEFDSLCKSEGIARHYTIPGTLNKMASLNA